MVQELADMYAVSYLRYLSCRDLEDLLQMYSFCGRSDLQDILKVGDNACESANSIHEIYIYIAFSVSIDSVELIFRCPIYSIT